MIKNNRYDRGMTTLGFLATGRANGKVPATPLDLTSLVASLSSAPDVLKLGTLHSITAALAAWTNQDDDAHEPCSLTACRHPLHPGPCKGWKGTLHAVSPGTYKQIEEERVKKANARRVKRIADLRAQGKPIPRRLLTEIKPKPAPTTHAAQNAQTVPLGQVNQKADLAGGQAHTAGQAVSKAAGVTVKTASLPLGPKQKKPTVAGRGPAFVITQPKVTDTYKLDKADKLTAQDWAALTDADKTTIRNELTAIKARGFGPQQTKADALLARLPAPGAGQKLTPGTPGTVTTPSGKVYQKVSATPGKVTLGQTSKTVPSTPSAPSGGPTSKTQAKAALDITEAIFGKQTVDPDKIADNFNKFKASGTDITQHPGFRLLVDRLANAALKRAEADKMPGLGHGKGQVGITEFNHQIRDHLKDGKPGLPPLIQQMADHHSRTVLGLPAQAPAAPAAPKQAGPDVRDQVRKAVASTSLGPAARLFVYRKLDKAQYDSLDDATKTQIRHDLDGHVSQTAQRTADELKQRFGLSGSPTKPTQGAPAASPATPGGLKPSAPLPPGTTADVQHANAVANRTAPKAQMAKTHLDSYGKLTKADFDSLSPAAQKTIRDDLANARGKFLDPKKSQAATDLLNRFGSRHPAPKSPDGTGLPAGYQIVHVGMGYGLQRNGKTIRTQGRRSATSQAELEKFAKEDADRLKGVGSPAPTGAKGYSDPMNEAVKAVRSGTVDTDNILKRVSLLSPATVGDLTDGDRKAMLGRLAFVATHPQATPEQKAKAAAFGRIINGGTHVPSSQKWDHTPSIGELHSEEQKGGHAAVFAAVAAARDTTMGRDARVKALTALTKPQFDTLTPDEQRTVTDTLQSLHVDRTDPNGTVLDKAVGDAITAYTGEHPGIHRLKQAEADFRAGKVTGDDLHSSFLTARVQAPGTTDKPGQAAVAAEAARIAKDNPTLPTYARVRLAGDQKYGNRTYSAIGLASMQHNWQDAPRFSGGDFIDLFQPTDADLAAVDPIHAQAVRDLQEHVLGTGLRFNSPWSGATKNAAVEALLNTDRDGNIDPDRLARIQQLSPSTQRLITHTLREKLNAQTSSNAKTETWVALRELEGNPPLTGAKKAAVAIAVDRMRPLPSTLDDLRKLTPDEFDELPGFTQDALRYHLSNAQQRVEQSGPVLTWTPQDNALKVFPSALMAHLAGSRTAYSDRRMRNASDITNYGQKVINPLDRTRAYAEVPIARFRDLTGSDQASIKADLDSIAADSSFGLPVRYQAQFTKDFLLDSATHLSVQQMTAVQMVDPGRGQGMPDADVVTALGKLDKADFDSLDQPYKDAIDARIQTLPSPAQQAINAVFHPTAAAATPSGYTPTPQASVPPHVQTALDTIYGVHPKSHTMAHQLSTYGALRGSDFAALNGQEQGHLLGDLSFIATTAKGPSADKAKKLIDRFTPAGTPSGQVPTGAIIPPANAVAGQVRYATPLKGLAKAKDSGKSGDGWLSLPGGGRVWGHHGAAGLLLQHTDPQTGEKRYLMVQRGPAISDPGKWTFPGGASDSKETPHEGATRETIEELGLKDDVFKDALVHGDHTFTVPNSTWKYTTVAASVPTMIKPDLSTAHARAETSDAKWMTEAEIKALDTAGKLHHPIAGGKLEQNVISLFPQGTGQKLGQVARPGPVTKRLKRLSMPSGGRQAPAAFNAWPHPHKPSKGKDLIPDKATFDAQRQKIKNDRKLYDGKTADGRLAAIGAQQGFDDTPTVVDRTEIDRLLATGDYIEAWRGVSGVGGWSARSRGGSGGKTAKDINEEMKTGPAYYGKGIFGNGYYLATQKRVAAQYSDGTAGSLVRILIPKSAVTQKYDKVSKESHRNPRHSKAKGASSYEDSTFYDPGRYAAAKGIDGIEIEAHHMSPGGGARHVAASGKPAFNWLNRSVLIVQKEPG